MKSFLQWFRKAIFTDFELKPLEVLKEEDEDSLRMAIEMVKEHFGFERKEEKKENREKK